MRFGMCTEGLRERVESFQKADYDYIELKVGDVLPEESEEKFAGVKEKIKEFSIKPEVFNTFISGKIIVFGSGGARKVPEGFSLEKAYQQLIDFLNLAADIAKKEGVTIVIEPLFKPASNIINLVKEGLQLTRDVNRQEVRLLADLFHMEEEDEPFTNLLAAKDEIAHIHIPVPVTEGYNHQNFFHYLKEINYQGRISVEDNGGSFEDIEKEATLLLPRLKKMWEEA